MTNPPMDWYPDPADATRERYWDGTQWTHNTRPARASAPLDPRTSQDQWRAQEAPSGGPVQWGVQQDQRHAQWPQQGQPPGQPQPTPEAWQGQQWPAQQPGQQWPAQQPWPPAAGVRPGPVTRDGVPLAGWWQRALAYLVDQLLVTLLATALGWVWVRRFLDGFWRLMEETVRATQAGTTPPQVTPEVMEQYGLTATALPLTLLGLGLGLLYTLLMWRFRGATLGQSLLGIRVVPTDEGHAPRGLGWGRALRRSLVFSLLDRGGNLPWVSVIAFPLALVSYLMPLWTARRQTLHDMAAGTQVVRSR